MPPALLTPQSPTLASLEDIDFVQDDGRLISDDAAAQLAGEYESIDATVARLLAEFEEENGPLEKGRADPPESEWPGRWVDVRDVAASAGDGRDWFSFEMRLKAHVRAMKLFRRARRYRLPRKRGLSPGFDFAQIMWVGDMGASKSVSAMEEAFFWFQRGHPFFHNGGFNIGRVIEGADIYEIISRIPMYSVVAIDEAHTGLESGMAMSTGVRSFAILGAGLRKKGCKLLLMSAMARMIVRIVREMTSEVRRPFKVNAAPVDHGFQVDYKPRNDPRNFVLAWDLWRDFPFRGVDIVDGRGSKRNDGLGKPDVTQGVLGETVRNAYLLTDSFRPVDSAHAQRYAGKAAMEAARAAQQQVGLTDDDKNMIVWLHGFLQRPDCPRNVRTAVIAMNQEVTDREAGRLMNRIFGDVDDVKGAQGWKTDAMRRTLAVRYGMQFAPRDEE